MTTINYISTDYNPVGEFTVIRFEVLIDDMNKVNYRITIPGEVQRIT